MKIIKISFFTLSAALFISHMTMAAHSNQPGYGNNGAQPGQLAGLDNRLRTIYSELDGLSWHAIQFVDIETILGNVNISPELFEFFMSNDSEDRVISAFKIAAQLENLTALITLLNHDRAKTLIYKNFEEAFYPCLWKACADQNDDAVELLLKHAMTEPSIYSKLMFSTISPPKSGSSSAQRTNSDLRFAIYKAFLKKCFCNCRPFF